MKDDFSDSLGHQAENFFSPFSSSGQDGDTSLPAWQLAESLDWLRCLDPEAIQSLLERTAPPVQEEHAVTFLSDLLEAGKVRLSCTSKLAVNWGDGTPVECYDPSENLFDPDWAHYFAKNGQYNVILAVSTGKGVPNFYRLIVQILNESGESTVMDSIGLE